eukprot:95214_1
MGLLDGANCQLVAMILLILIYGMSYGIDMDVLKMTSMVFLTLDQFVLIHNNFVSFHSLKWKSGYKLYKLLIILFGDESASELFITDICTCSRDGVDVLQIIIKFIYQHFVVKLSLRKYALRKFAIVQMCKIKLMLIDDTPHIIIHLM